MNFMTIDDLKKQSEPVQSKEERKTTDSYVGGKSSGIAVENPDEIDSIAIKLHHKEDKAGYEKSKNKMNISIYKNGFILDNGPFRPLNTEENKKFIRQICKGEIPSELVKKGITSLGVAVTRKDEDYIEKIEEKKFEAFTGQGLSLSKVDVTGLKIDTNVTSTVDRSKPVCRVNIRLFNGQIVNEEFNLCHSFSDVFNFVKRASNCEKFQILDGFPPSPITEMNKTIEELKLQGSTLTQKLC